MHEYALAENIFNSSIKTANLHNAKKILEVHLELGDFSLVVEEFLDHCFRILSKDSIAEGAKLIMTRTPGVLSCFDCSEKSEIWFNQEKQREDEIKQKEIFDKYEEEVAAVSGAFGYKMLGVNLFRCKNCGSRNTDLVGGKEIKIKNIKISD